MKTAMNRIDYHDRCFVAITTSGNADAGADTVFHYRQEGDLVWGTYRGASVQLGTLVAKVLAGDALDMRYQHINSSGEFMSGTCQSIPEVLPDGRLRLHESWQWTSGDKSTGYSVIEEAGRPASLEGQEVNLN